MLVLRSRRALTGIDMVSVHPSPVASRFYDKTHKMEMLDMVSLKYKSSVSKSSPSFPVAH